MEDVPQLTLDEYKALQEKVSHYTVVINRFSPNTHH